MPYKSRTYRDEAIVLKHMDLGEADRILTLFTKKHGKVRAVAKGVRKPKSKKAGHLEPFTHVNLLLAKGRNLHIITQAEALEIYPQLSEDLLLATYASYTVELVDRFTHDEEENSSAYRLLKDTLRRIGESEKPELALRYYEIHLLDLSGYRPMLFNCADCSKEIQAEDQYFSATKGGVLCPPCGKQSDEKVPINIKTLKYLRHFQRSNYQVSAKSPLDHILNQDMETILQRYITFRLERSLNTPPFIERARRIIRDNK